MNDYFTPVEPAPAPVRASVLHLAEQAITVDRAATHGKAEDSFGLIAAYWSAHLGTNVTAHDVGVMMGLFKAARIKGNPAHQDSYVDAAGYFALAAEIAGSK
jgi:hypothetical protein